MYVEAISAASTTVTTLELIQKSVPTFTRIFRRLRDGELKIAVFGAGGIGKTTLGKILSGQGRGISGTYEESLTIEKYKLDGNIDGTVIVATGQKIRDYNLNALLRSLSGGQVKLIIHVVCWGYHSSPERGISYTTHQCYQNGMSVDQFLEEYARDRRNRELEVPQILEPHLSIH